MRYSQALSTLNRLHARGGKLGLERINNLLSLMGNPHKEVRAILVGGTNGKGSVTAMISSALIEAGYRVGSFYSPHIDDFRERIQVNNSFIPKRKVVSLFMGIEKKKEKMKEKPTHFEIVTAMACKYFGDEEVDYAVFEVGLGGREDATNALSPFISVITNIGLEHTEALGNSLRSIAHEKAGIIRKNFPVVTAEREKEPLSEIKSECRKKNSPLVIIGKDVLLKKINCSMKGGHFIVRAKKTYDVETSLLGEHQGTNAATAIAVLEHMKIPKRAIENGIKRAHVPGRLEITGKNPLIVMDSAHNPHAFRELKKSLPIFPHKKLILVTGIMKDKDIKKIIGIIAPLSDVIIINKPSLKRAAPPSLILREAKKYNKNVLIVKNVKESLEKAKSLAGKDDLILVAGSMYMLAEARGEK